MEDTEMGIRISVVVPAFNEEKVLGETLKRIHEAMNSGLPQGWNWEVIVCDNHSTDRTGKVARAGGARVVYEEVNQIARARNTGARAALGEWLIFIDADSWPSRELIEAVVRRIEDGRWIGSGATLRMDISKWPVRVVSNFWNGVSRLTGWAAGSFILCKRSAFEEVGGFDEALYASEEINFSRRIKRYAAKRGKRFGVIPGGLLVTSSRKIRLYTPKEMGRLLLRSIFFHRKWVRSKDECHVWYDGRRE